MSRSRYGLWFEFAGSPVDFEVPHAPGEQTETPPKLIEMFKGQSLVMALSSGTIGRFDATAATWVQSGAIELADVAQPNAGLSPVRSVTSVGSSANARSALLTIALRPAVAVGTVQRYSYSGGADATALTLSNTNTIWM